MDQAPPSSQSTADESEVPPAVLCARCGRWDCATCEGPAEAAVAPTLPWEAPGALGERLWRTAHTSSTEPRAVFGALADGSVASALGFAFLAEALAIGSFAVTLVLAAVAVAPGISMRALADPTGRSYVAGGAFVMTVVMVTLHAMWGACLEFGAGATRAGLRQSLRFGLYACGWDLLTSPIGVLEGLLRKGPRATLNALSSAVRAPRPALDAYQNKNRHFEPWARRRGLRLSIVVLTTTLLALIAAAGFVLVDFATWLSSL